jgi:acyl carrier protein
VQQEGKSLKRAEFLRQMDEILGLRPGTLRGDERLEDLENWDSTALVSLIVLAESHNNASISPDQIVGCASVADLLRLARVDSDSSS